MLKGIDIIVRSIGEDCTQFFPLIIPSILNCISQEESLIESGGSGNHYSHFYTSLRGIIDRVPQAISQY